MGQDREELLKAFTDEILAGDVVKKSKNLKGHLKIKRVLGRQLPM